ncbi:putative molybdenum cofactor sulfurtransferase [Medicago truncatula]|uniref:Molybdenum cofactor sulfurase-like protein n=1 Tax=Medicago truncatula TaxID=3880 RepID=A0A072UPS3_MEDTR|nr:molybdenum cofactor sulfurase [Medicago truncatula]KEH31697.1 molybdenum cofactor sulfurase-like protein [Medicago truncatula]RHN63338.1 putative molybdenum cofactor sulfurtransferase [Medicago truncatula]
MQPPCSGGTSSQPCFNGCFPSPFLASENSHDNTSNSNSVSRIDDLSSATSSSLYPNTHFTNHESLPLLQDSYNNFIKSFPQFSTTSQVDQIRDQEYQHLNNLSNTCFDYTGYGLFSYAQQNQKSCSSLSSSSSTRYLNLEQSFFDVSIKSMNLKSQILYRGHESELESRMRERIMTFMNVSENDYALVFIANEVSAFKLVADSFLFQSKGSELLTVYDHNNEALEMMIDSCKKQEVQILSAEFTWPNLGIEWRKLKKMVTCKKEKRKGSLFVFPLYSKVTGSPYSYFWMSLAQENGWCVMLDLCALRPKERDTLGMSMFKPDFMVCSFYKIFGENPSGFGCLFVKKSSISSLKDLGNATSIGIISLVPTFAQCHTSSSHQNESAPPNAELLGFASPENQRDKTKEEQNEVSSLSEIVELQGMDMNDERLEIECRGLDHADSVGLIVISTRTRYLINWLVNALMSLQHPHDENRFSLIRIYGPKINSHRGPTVAFNIFDWKGEKIDPTLVQKLADRNNISLSRSCLKNIKFLDRNQEERELALETKTNEVEKFGISKKKSGSNESRILVLTATLGFLTNFEDVYRLWTFVSRFLDADFVEKERWRYIALNQKTIEV